MSEIEQMRLAALKTLQAISEDGMAEDIVRVNAAAILLQHTAQPSADQFREMADAMLKQADEFYEAKDKQGRES